MAAQTPAEPPPQGIRRVGDALEITWADGTPTRVPLGKLRANCPCASCDDARSKPKNPFHVLSEREAQAGPLAITGMKPVGHYAYQVTWNDGHNTGIYSLTALRNLSEPLTEA